MRKILVCLIILSVHVHNICGESEEEPRPLPGDLSLRIKSMNFIVNNEFFNPVTEGYTLLGFFFQPELVYTPSSNISLRAGAHLLKYYGTEEFSKVRPVFSTTLNLNDKTSLTLGTLAGSDKHHFFDPHFHSERLYNEYIEDGIQFIGNYDHIFTDTWVSWENFIFKGDSTREQFTMGESFKYSSHLTDFISIEVPVQFQLKHMGGQISDYSQHMQSFINIATGLRANFDLAGQRYGQVGIEYLQFINKFRTGDSIAGINHGYGSWIRLHYTYKAFRLQTGYWRAHDFYAPNGNPIYGSISDYQPDVVVHDRRIINSSASFKLMPASGLELYFGVELFYDIDLQRIDQSYTIHLYFDKLINLMSSGGRNREKQN